MLILVADCIYQPKPTARIFKRAFCRLRVVHVSGGSVCGLRPPIGKGGNKPLSVQLPAGATCCVAGDGMASL